MIFQGESATFDEAPLGFAELMEDPVNPDSPRSLPPRKVFPPFEALRAFDAVARLGGIRKAAQVLMRDHAVISRHLRTLESWTGTTLIERTPGGAVLTPEGQEFHRQIEHAMDTIANATAGLLKRQDDRCICVWCMPAFALHWMTDHLESFQKANPDLEIELRSTRDEPDFDRQEADVVIQLVPTFGPAPHVSASLQKIPMVQNLPTIPVASPEYLSACDEIKCPRDLLAHELLHEEDFDAWRHWFDACGIDDEIELSGPRLWHGHMTLAAAKRGQGVALSNRLVAGEDLAQGALVEIGVGNPAFKPIVLWEYEFVARADRWDARPIRRFRDWLLQTVNDELPDSVEGS